MKIERNAPCPCGSGKKYKKCCISNHSVQQSLIFSDFNPVEVVKTLALLQLVPENHGKNIRIERAIAELLVANKNKWVTTDSDFKAYDFKIILKRLNEHFPKDYREDPPENSFTENIMFQNGNNIVFPGVLEAGTQIVQTLLDTLAVFDDELPKEFLSQVKNGVSFLLNIHNYISENLGYERYEFEEPTQEFLHLQSCSIESRDIFEFTPELIQQLKDDFRIEGDIEKEFITDLANYNFDTTDLNSNELLTKPFITIGERLLLVMPSAELIAINEFIINKAREHSCYDQLIECYKKVVYSEFLQKLSSLGFQMTNVIKEAKDFYEAPYMNVLLFDTNKFAIVTLLKGNEYSMDFPSKEIAEAVSRIKKVEPHFKIHLIGIPVKISVMSGYMFSSDKVEGIDEFTILSSFDLKGISTLWKCDSLTLWKFEKSRSRTLGKMILSPGFTNLTYFNWYEKNLGSFFHSDHAYNYLVFDYNDQAQLIRQINSNLDLHMVDMIVDDNKMVRIPVERKEKQLPLYVPTRQNTERIYTLLELYDTPIWVSCDRKYYPFSNGFSDSVTYWLTEMFESISSRLILLGHHPVSINLDFDSRFIDKDDNIQSEESNLTFRIIETRRAVDIHIPYNFSEVVIDSVSTNYAERYLIGCVLTGLTELIKYETGKVIFDDEGLGSYVNSFVGDPLKRMIIPVSSESQIKYNNANTILQRYLQESDISHIRENILEWSGIQQFSVNTKTEKKNLCNKMVSTLIEKFRSVVHDFELLDLLRMVMYRHDSAVYYSSHIDKALGSKIYCFSKYDDIVAGYHKERKSSVPSVLSYRCLIEFIVAEPPRGKLKANNDDVDFLHALMEQIISFGNLSDAINEEFVDMQLDVLPSGRIGMDHSFFDNELNDFRASIVNNEIADMLEVLKKSKIQNNSLDDVDTEGNEQKIDKVFIKEWGIGLYQVSEICTFLSMYCIYKLNKSFVMMKEVEFYDLFKESPYNTDEVDAFCKIMTLLSRGNISKPPPDFRQEEIYPWRYSRQLSYIRRPLIQLDLDGEKLFLWSPRHMEMAEENLLAMFHNGSLKTNPAHKGIQSLLAKRNAINGKTFREKVYKWLENNSELVLIPYEVKIAVRGALKADENLGDIDIMAFDINEKKILLLEIKNTKQAKVTYEFRRDIENYLNDLIPKHDKRVKWVVANKEKINAIVDFDITDYSIYSAIISSSTLPVKYLDSPPMPVISFSELRSKGVILFNDN